ncbi:DUF2877 domain-containing protein [Pseudocitrobacter faecalis]|uniref:DUF2877 domain-containing protein n=1 Tax=Pseudocitrobacter faecalis TaxID=1398493 RepID=UPI0033157C8C
MQALTADAGFLAERGSGQIAQVFNRAVNLWLPARRRWLTLLSESCDNAPNSCRLALTHFDASFQPGQSIELHHHGVMVADKLKIDTLSCRCWQPPDLTLSRERFRQIPWLKLRDIILQQLQKHDTLFLGGGNNPFYQAISEQLQRNREILFKALRGNLNITSAVTQMIGLGIGLTPSSDDYLVGMSAILFIPGHPAAHLRDEFISALACAGKNTTSLSATTIEAAFDYRYRENIYAFIASLINDPRQLSEKNIADIKSIGSSSGCDMLFGMADGCALSQTYGGNYVS